MKINLILLLQCGGDYVLKYLKTSCTFIYYFFVNITYTMLHS